MDVCRFFRNLNRPLLPANVGRQTIDGQRPLVCRKFLKFFLKSLFFYICNFFEENFKFGNLVSDGGKIQILEDWNSNLFEFPAVLQGCHFEIQIF